MSWHKPCRCGLSRFLSLKKKEEEQDVRFLGHGEALRNMQEYPGVKGAQEFDSPIARRCPSTALPT